MVKDAGHKPDPIYFMRIYARFWMAFIEVVLFRYCYWRNSRTTVTTGSLQRHRKNGSYFALTLAGIHHNFQVNYFAFTPCKTYTGYIRPYLTHILLVNYLSSLSNCDHCLIELIINSSQMVSFTLIIIQLTLVKASTANRHFSDFG